MPAKAGIHTFVSAPPNANENAFGNRLHSVLSIQMDEFTGRTPPDWLVKSLERSQSQIAAGESVPPESFLDELSASIARMKAKRAAREAGSDTPKSDFPPLVPTNNSPPSAFAG
jgi:hypothetical protein